MAWTPLSVLIANEYGLSMLEQAELLSAFPLGYALTQVLGGLISDHFGGKPVQSIALLVCSLTLLAAPTTPVEWLYWLYFFSGIVIGPMQPAYSAMTAAWFKPAELGRVSSFADLATVMGEFVATAAVPLLAAVVGWRGAFTVLGTIAASFAILWLLLAASRPPNAAPPTAHQQQAAASVLAARSTTSYSRLKAALRVVLIKPLFAVVVQHMAFNGTKYMLAAWLPT